MSTSKPIFGPVVLEKPYGHFIDKLSSFHRHLYIMVKSITNVKVEKRPHA